jgi:hypothetical protein
MKPEDQPIDDFYIIRAMREYGGSFVHQLAIAFGSADDENTRRLKAAFPEYWQMYTEMGRKLQVEERSKV